VFSTVHTTDATKTIGRIIDVFPAEAQEQVRHAPRPEPELHHLAAPAPAADGSGMVVAMEIMLVHPGSIRSHLKAGPHVRDQGLIEKSRIQYGMQSFDQHLIDLYQAGVITLETAKAAATNPADFERALYVS
jgi:twitching motility protein PilT